MIRPKLTHRTNHTVMIGVEDALIPEARSLRKLWIIANGIERRLKNAMLPRLRILRHKENVAAAFIADFVYKLRERRRVRQVDVCVWLNSMTITAGNQQFIPLLRHLFHLAIFFPVT